MKSVQFVLMLSHRHRRYQLNVRRGGDTNSLQIRNEQLQVSSLLRILNEQMSARDEH